ncbi:MAG: FG-GAP-like repeat-containing protein [Bacteroidota bacterium]
MKCFYALMLIGILVCYNGSSQTLFEDDAPILGLNNHTGTIGDGNGLSFADFDDDGWDDITLTSGSGVPLRFYKNYGGFFVQETLSIEDIDYKVRSVSWVDYDNDGDKDLFVVSDTSNGSRLYKRDANDVFTNVTVDAGLPTDNLETHSVSWGDIDNDGCLELYMSNRTENSPIINYLFKNNCDGTFTDITFTSGVVSGAALTYCSGFFDFNNDGWQDLFVSNDKTFPNYLYKNNGDGTFSDVSTSSGADIVIDAMSVTIEDYNADGFFDIYITNTPFNMATTTTDGSVLLRNNGDETFTNVAVISGCELNSWCWGANFLDAENDGDLDVYVSCSYISSDGFPSYGYFESSGIGTFTNYTQAGFVNNDYRSYGNAIGDIENNGKVDIAVINNFDTNPSIWKNKTNTTNNYLTVSLEGTISNKDGVGSVIEIDTNGEKQYRYVMNGESYLSQNSSKEFFGLGHHTIIDSVKVKWLSGIEDILLNVPANQILNIVEGSTLSVEDYDKTPHLLYNNPINDIAIIKSSVVIDSYTVFDGLGKVVVEGKAKQEEINLDLSSLQYGIYYCELNFKNAAGEMIKLIKK